MQQKEAYFQWGGEISGLAATHAAELTVDGPIESKSGGIVFPDGSIQTTAAAMAPESYPQKCSSRVSAEYFPIHK